MLLLLTLDTVDTVYRFVFVGYLGIGITFPGVNTVIKPDAVDLIVFLFVQVGVVVGIYLLYTLKKFGGYLFLFSNILFLFYASIFGPIAEIGVFNIITPIFFFFSLYVFVAIGVPWFYSEEFK